MVATEFTECGNEVNDAAFVYSFYLLQYQVPR